MIVLDVLMTLKLLYKLFSSVDKLLKTRSYTFHGVIQSHCIVCIVSVIMAAVMRVYGALYQAVTGKLDKGCLQVFKGRLVQTPFTINNECMRKFEYLFIICNALPIVIVLFSVPLYIWICRDHRNKKYHKTNYILAENS